MDVDTVVIALDDHLLVVTVIVVVVMVVVTVGVVEVGSGGQSSTTAMHRDSVTSVEVRHWQPKIDGAL